MYLIRDVFTEAYLSLVRLWRLIPIAPRCIWKGCNITNAAVAAQLLQSCPTPCEPIDGSPPGSPSLGFSRQEHWSGLPFPSPMHESEKWKWSLSVMSDSVRPHGLQPTSLLHPWDFPGKSTGVGCHCLLLQYHQCNAPERAWSLLAVQTGSGHLPKVRDVMRHARAFSLSCPWLQSQWSTACMLQTPGSREDVFSCKLILEI